MYGKDAMLLLHCACAKEYSFAPHGRPVRKGIMSSKTKKQTTKPGTEKTPAKTTGGTQSKVKKNVSDAKRSVKATQSN